MTLEEFRKYKAAEQKYLDFEEEIDHTECLEDDIEDWCPEAW